jgi:tRNA 2-thiouridine synthesizing protein B
MILHTLNKSPFTHAALSDATALIAADDALLLMEDGVYALLPDSAASTALHALLQRGIKLYAIEADVRSRGIAKSAIPAAKQIGYDEFVTLTTQYTSVQSWY